MPRYCVLIKEAAPLDCSVPNWSVICCSALFPPLSFQPVIYHVSFA